MQGSILLVEDNPDDVEITLHTLRKIAVDVVVARDGDEAFEYLFGKSATELPLLVLLDLNLPRMNGVEVLKRIRAEDRTRSLPVVLLTDSRAEQDLLNAYASGANRFVRKPLDAAKLFHAAQQLGIMLRERSLGDVA